MTHDEVKATLAHIHKRQQVYIYSQPTPRKHERLRGNVIGVLWLIGACSIALGIQSADQHNRLDIPSEHGFRSAYSGAVWNGGPKNDRW